MNSIKKSFSALPEWHRHSATQLYWPNEWLDGVEEIYCRIVEELHFYEPIHLFVESLEIRNRVMQKLAGRAIDLDRVIIHQEKIHHSQAWKSAPLFVVEDGEYVILDWNEFEKSKEKEEEERPPTLARYIAEKFGMKRVELGIRLNPGSFDANGAGTLLAEKSMLHNSNQEPQVSRKVIEKKMRQYLGADQIIWINNSVDEDDICGQIDGFTRWLNEDTVLTMISEDPGDVNYDVFQENLEMLRSVILKKGKKLNIETLPLSKIEPQDRTEKNFRNVTANYAHFYIANGAVIVPLYNKNSDEKALNLFREYFPGRKIIGIECVDLALAKGAIHRITQPWYGTRNANSII